jgi:hypothetical protein
MNNIRHTSFWKNLLIKLLQNLWTYAGLNKVGSHHQHVPPNADGRAVKASGNEKLTALFEIREEAFEGARDIALNHQSGVIIHRNEDTLRNRRNYP